MCYTYRAFRSYVYIFEFRMQGRVSSGVKIKIINTKQNKEQKKKNNTNTSCRSIYTSCYLVKRVKFNTNLYLLYTHALTRYVCLNLLIVNYALIFSQLLSPCWKIRTTYCLEMELYLQTTIRSIPSFLSSPCQQHFFFSLKSKQHLLFSADSVSF